MDNGPITPVGAAETGNPSGLLDSRVTGPIGWPAIDRGVRVAGALQHQQVVVSSKAQFDQAIQQYIAQGYAPRQMTHEMAILAKPGQQNNLGCAFWFWVFVFSRSPSS